MREVEKTILGPNGKPITRTKGATPPFGILDMPRFVDAWNKQRSPSAEQYLKAYEGTVYSVAQENVRPVENATLRLYLRGKSQNISTVPIERSRKAQLRIRDNNVEEVTDHPLLRFIRRPNPKQDQCAFFHFVQLYQELIGTAYVFQVSNKLGDPQEWWILPSHKVTRKRGADGTLLGYEMQGGGKFPNGSTTATLEEVIEFTAPNPFDPYGEGYSPLRAIWEDNNIADKMAAHMAALLDNQARPDAIVMADLGDTEADRYEAKLNAKFRRGGHGSVAVVNHEGDGRPIIEPLGWPPTDLGIIEFRKEITGTIANAFSVPLSFLRTEGVPRANLEAAIEHHARTAVAPRLSRNQAVLNNRLITKDIDPEGRLFFAFDNPVPEDKEFELRKEQARATVALSFVTGGVATPNEGRAELGLDPIRGGDELRRLPGEMPYGDFTYDEPSIEAEPTATEPQAAPIETEQEIQTVPSLTLTGVQISSAMQIVQSVVEGRLPRESGIGALQVLLNLTKEQAETIMGTVGAGFVPAQPAAAEAPDNGEAPPPKSRRLILPPTESHKARRGSAPKLPSGKELAKVLARFFSRMRRDVLGGMKQFHGHTTKALPSRFVPVESWTDELANEVMPVVEIYFEDSGKALIQRVGASPDVFNVRNPKVQAALKKQTFQFVKSTIATTSKQINDAIADLREQLTEGIYTEGEGIAKLTDRVNEIFDGAERWKAQEIAKAESSRAHHEGLREAAKASGVVKGFEILTSSDPCPVCLEIAAKSPRVGLDGSFSVGEGVFADQLLPVHPNCECTAIEILDIEAD